MAKSERPNLSILIVSALLIVIIVRLFFIQIINGEEYEQISRNNFLKEVLVPSPRGSILDRFGKEIAVSRPVVNLYYKTSSTDDLSEIKKFLVFGLGIRKEIVKKVLNKAAISSNKNKRFLIKENLKLDIIYKIESRSNSFQSLELVVDYLRVYPFNEVGSHKFGYLKSNDKRDFVYGSFLSTRLGASGLEKVYDSKLQGENGSRYLLIDSRGREVFSKVVSIDKRKIKNIPGQDLSLTIDIEMEKLIYDSFGDFNGAAIVHDIESGEILALVSKPSFDPNLFSRSMSTKIWKNLRSGSEKPLLNRAFLSSNPPGSIIKIVTAVAALEEGAIEEETEYYCPGYYQLGERKFRCWKKSGHGKVNVVRALISSCDVFFYRAGLSLGVEAYSRWLENFGFGKRVALPFPQRPGVIPDKNFIDKYLKGKFYRGDMANVAIGQGYLTINPLQASIMTSIIASNGSYPNLRITNDGENIKNENLSISEKTLMLVQKGLLGVVNENGGTGFDAFDDGQLAGKTGTAQVISKSSRKYNSGKFKNHGWYTSYYPFASPKIVVTVFVENGVSGGRSAGPIIKKVVKYYKNNYLNLKGESN